MSTIIIPPGQTVPLGFVAYLTQEGAMKSVNEGVIYRSMYPWELVDKF